MSWRVYKIILDQRCTWLYMVVKFSFKCLLNLFMVYNGMMISEYNLMSDEVGITAIVHLQKKLLSMHSQVEERRIAVNHSSGRCQLQICESC